MVGHKLVKVGTVGILLAAAAGCSTKSGAATAVQSPSTAATSTATATVQPPESSSPAPTTTPTPALSGASAQAAQTAVGRFYGIYEMVTFRFSNGPTDQDAADAAKLFVDATAFHKAWFQTNSKTPAPAACGAQASPMAVVENPTTTDGTTASVIVTLVDKGQILPQQPVVHVDTASGKITSITCQATAKPTDTGLDNVIAFWNDQSQDTTTSGKVDPAVFAPPSGSSSQNLAMPNMDTDMDSCGQQPPSTFVMFPPASDTADTQKVWRVAVEGPTVSKGITTLPTVNVDSATGKIAWHSCFPFPPIPTAAPSAADRPMQASDLLKSIYTSYTLELASVSGGAQPTQDFKPYFASDTAYSAALAGTGKVPFTCNDTISALAQPGKPTLSGTIATFPVDLTRGVFEGDKKVGTAKISVDLTTFKITNIACQ